MMTIEMPDRTEDRPQTADRGFLRGLFDAAVAAAHPAHALPPVAAATGEGPYSAAFHGKAGGSMMSAAVRHYTESCGLSPDRLFGVGTARHGYEDSNPLIPMIGAASRAGRGASRPRAARSPLPLKRAQMTSRSS